MLTENDNIGKLFSGKGVGRSIQLDDDLSTPGALYSQESPRFSSSVNSLTTGVQEAPGSTIVSSANNRPMGKEVSHG